MEARVRRLALLIAVAACFVVIPLAPGSVSVLRGSGLIAGAGGTYTLTITNTGDEEIRCFQLLPPPGVAVRGVQGPAVWQVYTFPLGMGGQAAPGSGIPPGQSRTFTFQTTPDYPVDPATDNLFVSATCEVDSDAEVTVTGPIVLVAPPPPPPVKKPCKCKTLDIKLDGTLINKAPRLAIDDHDFGVGFDWMMKCTKGAGKCKGFINFSPPEILAGELPKPKQNLRLNLKKLAFVCQAKCNKTKTDGFQITMLSRDQLNVLFGRTLAYTIKTRCANQIDTIKVFVSINQNGKLRPGR